MIRTLLYAALAVVVALAYGAIAHAGRIPLARPELVPLFVFLAAVATGFLFPEKLRWFVIGAPFLAVALAMRGVFAGPALYANYGIYALFFAVFAAGRTAIDHEMKHYHVGTWVRNAILISIVGWVAFLATAPFASP